MPEPTTPSAASAAKHYASLGWRPLLLHGVNDEGLCTCKDRAKPGHEKSAGKHPVLGDWQNTERMDDGEIDAAWSGWRATHNVGLATGRPSGFFVLDVDPDNGGLEGIKKLQADHEPLTAAYAVQTGSGGWHLYFAMPEDFEPTNRLGGLKAYPGLDVRGTGGQVVAPPSRSAKGAYTVLSDAAPQPAPAWLLDLLRPETPAEPAPPTAPRVQDNSRLSAYASTVRDRELARLEACTAAATPDGTGYSGDPWNITVFEVSCSLLELQNSEWAGYDSAYEDVYERAPRDSGFTNEDVEKAWRSAVNKVGSTGRPQPVERESSADVVAAWMAEDGVRVDPILLAGPTVAEPEPDPDKPMRSWDDLGNAKRVVDHYGRGLRWVTEAEQWAVFREKRWQLVRPPVVQGYVQRMVDELLPVTEALHYSDIPADPDKPEDTERAQFLKWCKAQRMTSRIAAAQKEAQGRHELHASMADFDADPMLLNVANGVVDLSTGKLLRADPSMLLMRQCPVDYDESAPAPQWQRFLDRVMPDPEMQAYLQRVLGYSITGSTREQSLFIWHGDGANGKSICSGVVGHVLGDYGQVVAPTTLLASSQEDHPTGVAMMQGKRWLPATETAPGKRLDEERVKNLTGGEPVAARFMGKDFFEFVPSGKIHLITNHLPFLSDAKSIWRRIHLIKWSVSIPESQQDRNLERKLLAEAPGILAWLVRGALEWQRLELAMPASARADLAEYRGDSDLFGDFLMDRTMPGPGAKTSTADLYSAYEGWAVAQGIRKPMTQQSFVATMVERKFERYHDARARGFRDIVVVQPSQAVARLPWEEIA